MILMINYSHAELKPVHNIIKLDHFSETIDFETKVFTILEV